MQKRQGGKYALPFLAEASFADIEKKGALDHTSVVFIHKIL